MDALVWVFLGNSQLFKIQFWNLGYFCTLVQFPFTCSFFKCEKNPLNCEWTIMHPSMLCVSAPLLQRIECFIRRRVLVLTSNRDNSVLGLCINLRSESTWRVMQMKADGLLKLFISEFIKLCGNAMYGDELQRDWLCHV